MERLLEVAEARSKLLEAFSPVDSMRVKLVEAVGRVLAETITARVDLPPFNNSSMDGFAVRAADLEQATAGRPIELAVTGDIPAGQEARMPVGPGQAARIMTGAPLPHGADSVIPVEDTDFNERDPGLKAPERVYVYRPVKAGENVRPAGQDVRAGETVLTPNVRLKAQDIGFLAMLGVSELEVYRRPRAAVLSTGDELLPVGQPLEPGKIYDSNAFTLAALIERNGGDSLRLGVAVDEPKAVEALLDRAVAESVDMIISTAGVSVGAFDFVRSVVEKRGRLGFWRVNMRPGKPLAFGHYRDVPFFGLPGNPVSAFVGFEVFVRPALLKMAGLNRTGRPTNKVELLEPVESDGRESYLRAVAAFHEGRWAARLTGHQGSGNMRSLVQANALLIVPSGVKSLPIGTEVEAWFFDEILTGADPEQGNL